MYHRVGEPANDWEHKYCVEPERFAAHMRTLDRRGFKPCAVGDFVAWLDGKKFLPEQTFLLTFDDGFLDVYLHALPVLADLNWPATIFLVSEFIGRRDEWARPDNSSRSYPLLGMGEIDAMRRAGFTFQSHSRSHRDLTKLSDWELTDELAGARSDLRRLLSDTVSYLAYPYGRHDDRVVAAARSAGYAAAFSVQPGFNRPGVDPFRIRRLDVFGTDTPSQLLRKVTFGSNNGSWRQIGRYLIHRVAAKIAAGKDSP
jgi:peptidoglycan/xylan/chitin deacetylase (PgdA/CDA1 family)